MNTPMVDEYFRGSFTLAGTPREVSLDGWLDG